MYNFKSLETMYAELQSQSERDKLNAYRDLVTKCTNVYNPLQSCKEEVEVEPVEKPKSPFEIRVDLWNAVNEEIAQVEEFLKNLTLKQPWIAKFFNVQCYRKDRTGFTVDTGRKMELPAALQEKMIRAAEDYLEELKKQREDMERGYE
jgi:hypothetical protein